MEVECELTEIESGNEGISGNWSLYVEFNGVRHPLDADFIDLDTMIEVEYRNRDGDEREINVTELSMLSDKERSNGWFTAIQQEG